MRENTLRERERFTRNAEAAVVESARRLLLAVLHRQVDAFEVQPPGVVGIARLRQQPHLLVAVPGLRLHHFQRHSCSEGETETEVCGKKN